MLGQLLSVVDYHHACLFLREESNLLLQSEVNSENLELDCHNIYLPIMQSALFQEIEVSKQPYLLNNISSEFNCDPIMNGSKDAKAWLGVPLVHRNHVLGLLTIDSRKPCCFAEEDVQIVSTFAQQAAIAISNARLFQEEKTRTNDLLVLNNSQVEITMVPSVADTADKIADCVINLLHCDISGVALYNHDTREIYALPQNGYRGVNAEYAYQFRFHINEAGGYVLRNRHMFSASPISACLDPNFGQKFVAPIKAEAVMAAPLFVGEREVGILFAGHRTTHDFMEDEKATFSILANQAAVALRNAELFSETERRAELLALFHQISIAGQRTSNLDHIINIVLTGVTAEYGLHFNRALLLLVDSTGKYFQGYTGIGQTDKGEAEVAWASIEDDTIDRHVADVLHNGIRAWTPMHSLAQNLSIPIETDSLELFSHVYLTQAGLIVDSSKGEWRINQDFYSAFKPNVFALVPLINDQQVIGMLVADKRFIDEAITKNDLDLLNTCASQAAAAIERARLYKNVQNRIRELNQLQETTQDVIQLNNLQQVLQRIVKAANEVFDGRYLLPRPL